MKTIEQTRKEIVKHFTRIIHTTPCKFELMEVTESIERQLDAGTITGQDFCDLHNIQTRHRRKLDNRIHKREKRIE